MSLDIGIAFLGTTHGLFVVVGFLYAWNICVKRIRAYSCRSSPWFSFLNQDRPRDGKLMHKAVSYIVSP
jgi:hypothetical protein